MWFPRDKMHEAEFLGLSHCVVLVLHARAARGSIRSGPCHAAREKGPQCHSLASRRCLARCQNGLLERVPRLLDIEAARDRPRSAALNAQLVVRHYAFPVAGQLQPAQESLGAAEGRSRLSSCLLGNSGRQSRAALLACIFLRNAGGDIGQPCGLADEAHNWRRPPSLLLWPLLACLSSS